VQAQGRGEGSRTRGPAQRLGARVRFPSPAPPVQAQGRGEGSRTRGRAQRLGARVRFPSPAPPVQAQGRGEGSRTRGRAQRLGARVRFPSPAPPVQAQVRGEGSRTRGPNGMPTRRLPVQSMTHEGVRQPGGCRRRGCHLPWEAGKLPEGNSIWAMTGLGRMFRQSIVPTCRTLNRLYAYPSTVSAGPGKSW
jgi:hypothetical protein